MRHPGPMGFTLILDLGLLLLFATPLIGVLVALFEFASQHDRHFVVTTIALVLVLVAGFAVAQGLE